MRGTPAIAKNQHFIRVCGPGAQHARISGHLLRDVLDLLVEGSRGAVRVRVEGRSSARGAAPTWLVQATDFEVVGLREGSTVLVVEADPLCVAAPQQFQQGRLFVDLDTSQSCVDVFSQTLAEAAAGCEESEFYDQALLRRFGGMARLLDRGLESVEIRNGANVTPTRVGRVELEQIDGLIRRTPPSQQVKVAGQLDTIRHSDRMFVLMPEDGSSLKGLAVEIPPDQLATMFGQLVIVSGTAHFRPSGSVLRIDAAKIELAEGDVSVWSRPPKALFSETSEADLRRQQGPRSGLNAIMGRWPGDESEAEISAALAEMS